MKRREIYNVYFSLCIIWIKNKKEFVWTGGEEGRGDKKNAYRILIGKA
jgi:hypothetical protein